MILTKICLLFCLYISPSFSGVCYKREGGIQECYEDETRPIFGYMKEHKEGKEVDYADEAHKVDVNAAKKADKHAAKKIDDYAGKKAAKHDLEKTKEHDLVEDEDMDDIERLEKVAKLRDIADNHLGEAKIRHHESYDEDVHKKTSKNKIKLEETKKKEYLKLMKEKPSKKNH